MGLVRFLRSLFVPSRYPWKGVLDVCANRCFSNGTNAWTAVDNTTYTAVSAAPLCAFVVGCGSLKPLRRIRLANKGF
jgi:hypothetical protein